jgi:hypothetical protein
MKNIWAFAGRCLVLFGQRPHRAGAIEEIVEMMDAAAPKPGRPKTYKKARWFCHTKKGR